MWFTFTICFRAFHRRFITRAAAKACRWCRRCTTIACSVLAPNFTVTARCARSAWTTACCAGFATGVIGIEAGHRRAYGDGRRASPGANMVEDGGLLHCAYGVLAAKADRRRASGRSHTGEAEFRFA